MIVDGNNLAYRIYESFKHTGAGLLTNSYGVPTTVIFGIFNTFNNFVGKYKVEKAIICWDVGGGSKFRKKLFPHYKANRSYTDMDDYFAELDSARVYLEEFGVNQAVISGVEADDSIGWLAKKYARKDKVIIFSDDKDFYQVLGKNIKQYRPIKGILYSKSDVVEELGYDPKMQPKLDALTGQGKDNIPGASDLDADGVMIKYGMGPAKAKQLLFNLKNPDSTLKQAIKMAPDLLSEKLSSQLVKNKKQVMVSFKLSRIRIKDSEYNKQELKVLQGARKVADKNIEVKSRDIVSLSSDLDFKQINTVNILKSIGVNVTGNKKPKIKRVKV
jgi:5'-3' exonuclease